LAFARSTATTATAAKVAPTLAPSPTAKATITSPTPMATTATIIFAPTTIAALVLSRQLMVGTASASAVT
jgi:hypothetical protein